MSMPTDAKRHVAPEGYVPGLTTQQKVALRVNPVARKVRKRFAAGTRVEGAPGHFGVVEYHIPGTNAQGGHLVVKWDSGAVGRHSAVDLTVL